MDEPQRELRIGDRERRAVDVHLRRAHADGVLTATEYDERVTRCRAARTRAQLDELVRDLPEYPPSLGGGDDAVLATPADGTAGRPRRTRRERLLICFVQAVFLSLALFVGLQVFGADDGAVVLGSREFVVGPDQGRVEVGVLQGYVRVVVPEGVQARVTRGWPSANTSCTQACSAPGRVVVVHVVGMGGRVEVLTTEEFAAEKAAEAAREDESR